MPRGPAGVAWQPRQIGAVEGSPMPSRAADRLRAVVAQHVPRPAVGAGGGRRILPEHELVLADDGAVGVAAAVAGGAAAAGDAEIGAGADPRVLRGRARGDQENEDESGEEACRAQADRDVAAAPQSVLRTAFGPAKKWPQLWDERPHATRKAR